MKAPIWNTSIITAFLFASLASGCGHQSFEAVQAQQNSDAPGTMSIAPKVDILLAVDNSGSTCEIRKTLNAALANFLVGLQGQAWDFRVTAMPLIGSAPLGVIASSKEAGFTAPANFRLPETCTPSTSQEPGLSNIAGFLANSSVRNSFLRSDATLAIIVISNGDDTSEASSSSPPYLPPATVSSSIIGNIRGASKTGVADLFPVVSHGRSCFNETAYPGTRYINAGSQLGNHAGVDLCSGSMSGVLSTLSNQLQAITINYVKRYVLIDSKPNLSTVKITKHAASGALITVPESNNGSDGWKYLGTATVPMISEPTQMDFRTGYAIQLIGDAYKLTGTEFVTVEYIPDGVTSSK